jgi:hypothetical protein
LVQFAAVQLSLASAWYELLLFSFENPSNNRVQDRELSRLCRFSAVRLAALTISPISPD